MSALKQQPQASITEKEWIESPDGWGPEEAGDFNLFADPDPSDTFTFSVPQEGDSDSILLQLHGYKLDSSPTAQSTGVTLWQAAPLLGTYLVQTRPHMERVLELGAGLGLAGLVAHHLGARHCVLTDGDTNVLDQLRKNVASNRSPWNDGIVECKQLLWGKAVENKESTDDLMPLFDMILAADVIYGVEAVELLFDTIVQYLDPSNGQVLLSWVTRWNGIPTETVREAATARGLDWKETEVSGVYRIQFHSTSDK